jgi:hypothetical protein
MCTSHELCICIYWRGHIRGRGSNRSRMDIKRKICDIRTWYKHLFLDISSTSTDTLVPSLYHCLETRSVVTVVWATSVRPFQSLRHQRNVHHISRPNCEPLYVTNTSHRKQESFLHEYALQWGFLLTKYAKQNTVLKHACHFDYWNQPLNMRMGVCYLDIFILKK